MMITTKKRKKGLIAALACTLAFCLALIGCGGGGDIAKNFIGTWNAIEMESEGEVLDAKDFEDFGLSITLVLAEDKTFSLDLMGDIESGTWAAKDASTCTLTSEGMSFDLKLANNKLSMEIDSEKIVFEKSSDSTTKTAAAPKGSTDNDDTGTVDVDDGPAAAGAETLGITIADDDICTIVVLDKAIDFFDDPGYNLKITNNSDKTIYVSPEYSTFSVGNKMIDPSFGETILPGKYVETFMYFDSDEIGGGIEKLVDVDGVISVDDDKEWDELAKYEFKL